MIRDDISSQLAPIEWFSSSFPIIFIASVGKSSASCVRSSPVFWSRESASSAWGFISACWTTSILYSDNLSRQRSSLPVLFVSSRIHFGDSWFVLNLNLVISKYGRERSAAHAIARHSHCFMSNRRLAAPCDLVEFSIGLSVLSGFYVEVHNQSVLRRRLSRIWGHRSRWKCNDHVRHMRIFSDCIDRGLSSFKV